jgi:hypothetical protein
MWVSQISIFSDEFVDYVCITDIYNAFNKNNESIISWLTSNQSLLFLDFWGGEKHNQKYDETQFCNVKDLARIKNGLSVETYIKLTKSIGLFTIIERGINSVTYAHIDIAINYSAYLSPKFEIQLIKELKWFKEVERKKDSFETLTHEQILFLVRVKDVYKFIAHQNLKINPDNKVFFV